jgi:uncharacterized OB-fold protein
MAKEESKICCSNLENEEINVKLHNLFFHLCRTHFLWLSILRIRASKCSQCGKAVVPPRYICPYCGPSVTSIEMIDLSNQGIILSYTVHHMPPDGFESPLLLALVKLENDAVVLCTGDISDANKIQINQSVHLDKDESGKFKLILRD